MFGGAATRAPADERDSTADLRRASAAEVAWLLVLPCAVATMLVVWLLGPPLGEALYPDEPPFRFLPDIGQQVTPEPLESARYLLALTGPALLALATALAARSRAELSARTVAQLVGAAQGLVVAVLVACLLAQRAPRWTASYFTPATLVVAAATAAALAWAARSEPLRDRWRSWSRAAERWRWPLLAVALAATAVWALPAVNTERSIGWSILLHDGAFHFDETFAVLNGLTPLSDFNAQYASLFPYAIALSLLAFGKTVTAFTVTLCALTVLALLAIYGVLRRAAGSALAALLLFLPFMATSLFALHHPVLRFSPGTYFPMFPLRYGGPYLLAWLVARHLARGGTRVWPLFAAAGLVLLNNVEFGVPALGATIAAVVWTSAEPSRRQLARLLAAVAGGLAIPIAGYALFSLVRSGALPGYGRTILFSRLYGLAGFSVAPLPAVIGLPLAIFITYAAALTTATVRATRGAPNRVLTGMLAWSAVFGFGSGTYYVARSNFDLLPMMFSAWALALALLTIVVLRELAASPRRPGAAALAVLFGFGLTVCSLAQAPAPWTQLSRVHELPAGVAEPELEWSLPPSQDPSVRRFVSSLADGRGRFVVRSGAPVALLETTGHRVADAYDVRDVVPFTGPESIHTVEQLETTLDALRDAGGNTVLVAPVHLERVGQVLHERGFAVLTDRGLRRLPAAWADLPAGTIRVGGLTKWVDLRRLHAPALR